MPVATRIGVGDFVGCLLNTKIDSVTDINVGLVADVNATLLVGTMTGPDLAGARVSLENSLCVCW